MYFIKLNTFAYDVHASESEFWLILVIEQGIEESDHSSDEGHVESPTLSSLPISTLVTLNPKPGF